VGCAGSERAGHVAARGLEGGADFASEGEYDLFLIKVLEAANLVRAKRLAEELAAMGVKPVADLADYRELMVSVNNSSTSESTRWFARCQAA
jgi:hypothetical protein